MKLWDNTAKDAEPIAALASPLGFHHVATNKNNILAAVSFDGKVHLFDLDTLSVIDTSGTHSHIPLFSKTLQSNSNLVIDKEQSKYWAVSLAIEKAYMVLSTIEGAIEVWNIEDLKAIVKVGEISNTKKGFGLSVDISADGSFISCGHETGALFIYRTNGLKMQLSISGHSLPIRAVKFSPTGNLLAVAGDSKLISLYTVSTGEHITNFSGHNSWIFSLAWNESGEFLVSSSYEGKAKVWSTETMMCVATIFDSTKPLLAAAWLDKEWGVSVLSGISRGIVTVGEEATIRWYRDASGK